jgi:membrane protein implicated in regulation of membrane protease activity/DNA-binding CsgD family transcriptional regulator
MLWLLWLVIALVALAGEALTTALILGSFGVAALIVSPLALFLALPFQIVAFGGLSLILLLVARPAAMRLLPAGDTAPALPRTGPAGQHGVVVERVDEHRGQIRVGSGEFWSARSVEPSQSIAPGRQVEVVRVEGLTALVRPIVNVVQATESEPRTTFGLSARELEVLSLLAQGLSNQEIADRLVLSPRTVHHHVSHIFDKMGVNGRVDAVRLAIRQGLVTDGSSGPTE